MSFEGIMFYKLHAHQFVSTRYKNYVSFLHRAASGKLIAFHLKLRHFENFNDIIYDLDFYSLRSYPLGDNVWMYKKDKDIQLVDHSTDRYFIFYNSSWQTYKRRVHHRIMSLCYHGEYTNHQRDARHARSHRARSRKALSTIRRKVISRTTRDAAYANEQRTQHSTIPSRHNSNPRSPSPSTSGGYAMRSASPSSNFNNSSLSDYEHCNQYSIADEETVPTKHE